MEQKEKPIFSLPLFGTKRKTIAIVWKKTQPFVWSLRAFFFTLFSISLEKVGKNWKKNPKKEIVNELLRTTTTTIVVPVPAII